MSFLDKIRRRAALPVATAAALLIGAVAPAFAVGPISLTLETYPQYNEYAASILNLTPSSTATDFFTLSASSTKTVWLRRITCTGVTTAANAQSIELILRSTADTGGTSTAPVAAELFNSAGAGTGPAVAATAAVAAYTVNPTGLGTSAGIIATGLLQTLATASTGTAGVTFDFPITDPSLVPVLIKGSTSILALNAGGATGSGASLSCTAIWSEH